VAEWAGVAIDHVQQLNPELRHWITPLRGDTYPLRVPAGTAAKVEQRLAESPAEGLATLQYHTVRKGETLASIARKLAVKRADLADANYLRATSRVAVGQQLVIPRAPTTLLTARADRPVPADADAEPLKTTYRVRRGDTLYSIARSFNTTVASLRTWNKIRGDRIVPGDVLTVAPVKRTAGGQH
jgi:membrane-bound lytic murein transglycosylase D